MFKKFFSMVLVCAFFTVQANASTQSGLKAAFDEMNYALTVEWDQKDKDFYTEQMKTFMNKLRELQAKGLTNEQLMEFAKSEVKDAKVAKDLETAFNMISLNKLSAEDASKFMVDTMKRSYNVGASYQGSAVYILAAVGVLFIAAAIVLGATGTFSGSYCSDVYVCDTECYYDYYYGYTCYDNCYYACY